MAYAAGGIRRVELRNQIVDLRVFAERLEAVSEALWNVKLAAVLIR